MLSIKLNGQPVVLKEDFSFSMTRENPIFNDPEALAGDYIESMTFPMEGNRVIFQNSNRISSNIRGVDYDIAIYFNGYHLVTGTFTVKSAGADYISGDAKLNALSFFYKIKDLKMTDLPETEVFGFSSPTFIMHHLTEGDYSQEQYPFTFPPILNEDFYDDSESFKYGGIINDYYLGAYRLSEIISDYSTDSQIIKLTPIVPCFYLSYLIKTMIKAQQYSIKLPTHSLLDKLILATNCSLDSTNDGDNSILTQSRTEFDIYDGITLKIWRTLLHTKITSSSGIILNEGTTFIVKKSGEYKIRFAFNEYKFPTSKPDPYSYKLQIVSNMQTIEVENNQIIFLWTNETFTINIFVQKIYVALGDIYIDNISEQFLQYEPNIYTNKHVPEIPQLQLFTIIKGIFNAGFFVNDAKREIETVTFNEIMEKYPTRLNIKIGADWSIDKSPMGIELKYDNSYTKEEHPNEIKYTKNTYDEIPFIGSPGDYAYVINEGSIYEWDDDEEGWELFNVWNQESKIEEDEMISFDIPIELPNMTIADTNTLYTYNDPYYCLMPQLSGKGISVFNKKTENKDFAILIYHGKQLATTNRVESDKTGPLASIVKYDGRGNVIDPDHSILLDDIVKSFHQGFINFIRTSREVKFKTKMRIVDFMKLRLQEKYTADGYVFIIKSMKMNVTVKDYSFVEMVIAVI